MYGIDPTQSPYNADWSGATDASQGLIMADAAAASAGTRLLLPPGSPKISKSIIFTAPKVIGFNTTFNFDPTATYSAPLVSLDGPALFDGVTISCNNSAFLSSVPLSITSQTDVQIGPGVHVNGQFHDGIVASSCQGLLIHDGARVTSTATGSTPSTTSYRGVQLEACTSSKIGRVRIEGNYSNHLASDDNGTLNQWVNPSMEATATTVAAFGLSFTYADECVLIGGDFKNTYAEAVQMTSCNRSQMIGWVARWDSSHGTDFGCSQDANLDCYMQGKVYNSYKAAAGIAVTVANAAGCGMVMEVTGYNSAVRETTAGGTGAAFEAYAQSTGSDLQSFEFRNCRCYLDSGNTINWRYFEGVGSGATVSGGKVKYLQVEGPGTVQNQLTESVVNWTGANATRFWDNDPIAFYLSMSSSTGTLGSHTSGVQPSFQRIGRTVSINVQYQITSAGASPGGAVLIALPTQIMGPGLPASCGLSGREGAVTGVGVTGSVQNTSLEVFMATGAGFAGINGYNVSIGGAYVMG